MYSGSGITSVLYNEVLHYVQILTSNPCKNRFLTLSRALLCTAAAAL